MKPWLTIPLVSIALAAFAACGQSRPAASTARVPARKPTALTATPSWVDRVRAGTVDYDEVRFHILPLLRPPAPSTKTPAPILDAPGPAGLRIEYRIDWPGGWRPIPVAWPRRWQVDVGAIAKQALTNLTMRFERMAFTAVGAAGSASYLELDSRSPYMQSLVLLAGFWQVAAKRLGGGKVLVAIPDRSRLIAITENVLGADSPLPGLTGKLGEYFRGASEPVLGRFLERDARGKVIAGPVF